MSITGWGQSMKLGIIPAWAASITCGAAPAGPPPGPASPLTASRGLEAPPVSHPLPGLRHSAGGGERATLTRRQLLTLAGVLALQALATSVLLRLGPSSGGQYQELGTELGQGVVRNYEFVADRQRQLYWPNQEKYVEAIEPANRVFLRDLAALKDFPNYVPGPL